MPSPEVNRRTAFRRPIRGRECRTWVGSSRSGCLTAVVRRGRRALHRSNAFNGGLEDRFRAASRQERPHHAGSRRRRRPSSGACCSILDSRPDISDKGCEDRKAAAAVVRKSQLDDCFSILTGHSTVHWIECASEVQHQGYPLPSRREARLPLTEPTPSEMDRSTTTADWTAGLTEVELQAAAVVTISTSSTRGRSITVSGASLRVDDGTRAMPWPQPTNATCAATDRTSCRMRGEKSDARHAATTLSK